NPWLHGHTQLNPGPRKNEPEIVSVAPNMNSIVNRMIASLRSPGFVEGLRSVYGTAASPGGMNPGIVTPATMGWKYRRSSCRPRKYHGAFDGFGVRFGLASSRSGALITVEKMSSAALTTRSATNSSIIRWGNVLTRSPCSRSTRCTPSGATSARRRCLSGAPGLGEGGRPVGGGAIRPGAPTPAGTGAAATAPAGAAAGAVAATRS